VSAADFSAIRRRAESRKGGAAALQKLLPIPPYTHLSRICAMSISDNYDADTILKRMQGDE
jgi:hypothetical protein